MKQTGLIAHVLCFLLLATSFASLVSLTGLPFLQKILILLLLSFTVSYLMMRKKAHLSSRADKILLVLFDAVALVFFVYYSLKVYDEGFLLRFVNLLEIIVCFRAFLIRVPRDYTLFYFCGLVLIGCASFLTHELYFVSFLFLFYLLLILSQSLTSLMQRAQRLDLFSFRETKKTRLVVFFLMFCAAFSVLTILIFPFLPRARALNARIFPLFFGEDESHFVSRKNPQNDSSRKNASENLSLFNNIAVFDGASRLNEKWKKSRANGSLLLNPVVMYVRSTRPSYWRGQTFDFYTGHSWLNKETKQTVSGSRKTVFTVQDETENSFNRLGSVRERIDQIFFIKAPLARTLYAAYVPKTFYFPAKQLRVYRSLSMESPFFLNPSLVYYVRSERIQYNPNIFKDPAPRFPPSALKEYLQLPYRSSRLENLAKSVTRGHHSTLKKAEALAAYLRTQYTYDLEYLFKDIPHNKDLVEYFLFDARRGHCEMFASAFVVLARYADIPSRFITGYAPGIYNPVLDSYEVRALDGHAWAESYIPEVGWLQFEPTPESDIIWKKLAYGPESPFLSSLFAYILFRLEKIPQILPRKQKARSALMDRVPLLKKLKNFLSVLTAASKKALASVSRTLTFWFQRRFAFLCILSAGVLLLGASARFRSFILIFTLRTYYTVMQTLFSQKNVKRQIFEMYSGSLAALKSAGFLKNTSETPYEFLERCRVRKVKKDALTKLTELFVKMRYSPHTLTREDGRMSRQCFYRIADYLPMK